MDQGERSGPLPSTRAQRTRIVCRLRCSSAGFPDNPRVCALCPCQAGFRAGWAAAGFPLMQTSSPQSTGSTEERGLPSSPSTPASCRPRPRPRDWSSPADQALALRVLGGPCRPMWTCAWRCGGELGTSRDNQGPRLPWPGVFSLQAPFFIPDELFLKQAGGFYHREQGKVDSGAFC